MSQAIVKIFGTRIGQLTWDSAKNTGSFRYDEAFLGSGIQLAPVCMPLSNELDQGYSFPELNRERYQGLPGMLADSLPDEFGQLLLDSSLNPVQQLCQLGSWTMGALEFEPDFSPKQEDRKVDLNGLIETSGHLLSGMPLEPSDQESLSRVAISAGGSRAKALVAWDRETNELYSSNNPLPEGFEHWLIKLDGVTVPNESGQTDPQGNGRIEFAYHAMADEAGITMADCALYEEFGRAHFMTRRFDRTASGERIHLQSLAALAHLDESHDGLTSYEQAFNLSRRLGLPYPDLEELYRRAVFNLFARNQDDSTKNTSFLMNRRGQWSLAPAYDITFSHQASGAGTGLQKMSLGGKRDDFTVDDLLKAASGATVKPRRAKIIIDEVRTALDSWSKHAFKAKVPQGFSLGIARQFRDIS